MTVMRRVATLALVVVLGAIPKMARTQTEMGRLTGTVSDQTGGLLPGASVKIRNLSTQAARTAVTDSRGAYAFSNLAPGSYEVTVDMAGFGTRQHQVVVAVGSTLTVNVKLDVGQQSDVLTVLALSLIHI